MIVRLARADIGHAAAAPSPRRVHTPHEVKGNLPQLAGGPTRKYGKDFSQSVGQLLEGPIAERFIASCQTLFEINAPLTRRSLIRPRRRVEIDARLLGQRCRTGGLEHA